MSTKTTKATNKVRASAPGRNATKLVATPTNGPALIGYARVSTSDHAPSFEPRRRRARPETAAASLKPS